MVSDKRQIGDFIPDDEACAPTVVAPVRQHPLLKVQHRTADSSGMNSRLEGYVIMWLI